MLPADPQRSAAASHSTKSPAKPTWCKLTPDVFDFVTRHLYTQRTPENIIFIHEASVPLMDAGAAAVSAAAAADSTQGRSGSTTSSTGSTTTTTTSSSTTGGSGSSVSDTSAVGAVSTGGRAGHGAQGSTASHGLSLASQHSSGNIGLAANSRGSISKAAVGNAGASINKHVLLAQHAAVGGTLHSQQQHEPVSSSKRVRLQHQLSTA